MRRLVIIAGKRKAGTTLLFHALQAAWKPSLKDRGWDETRGQIAAFAASGAATGAIAKADAIHDAPALLEALQASPLGPDQVTIVVLDRAPYERFLSFLAHARKGGRIALDRARAEFDAEESAAAEGLATLRAAGCRLEELAYEDLAAGTLTEVAGLPLTAVKERLNARDQVLPMFGLISGLVETRWYERIRETRTMGALKRFYYRNFAGQRNRRNGAVRIVVLGSVAGPMDGQRRITGIFSRKASFSVRLLDYDGHRRWWGPAQIAWQTLQSTWLALTGRVDVAYLAISRTGFGLIRDWLLLTPLRLAGARVVAHVHGAEFEPFYLGEAGRMARLKARQLAQVDRFVFIHEALVPDRQELRGRSVVLRNPIPHLPASRSPQSPDSDIVRLGFISSFVPGKGIEDFLLLAECTAGTTRHFVAGGVHPKFPDYGQKIVEELKSRPTIDYLGYLKNAAHFYERVDLVVFPTSYTSEALPGVVIEALSFGCLPVVRRSNLLPEVFAGAPVLWFDTADELVDRVRAELGRGAAAIRAGAEARRDWVRNAFPTEASWVEALERHLIGWDAPDSSDAPSPPPRDEVPVPTPNTAGRAARALGCLAALAIGAMLATVSDARAQMADHPPEGQPAPSWYEASRLHLHTRLSPNRLTGGTADTPWFDATFRDAGRVLEAEGVRVLTRHLRSAGETPPWEAGSETAGALAMLRTDAVRHEMRTIAYFWHSTDDALARAHPDYLCRTPQGATIAHRVRGSYMDLLGPYGEITGDRIARLPGLGFDGVYLDERHFPPQGCFGGALEAAFRAEEAGALPPPVLQERQGAGRDRAALKAYQGRAFVRIAQGWRSRLRDPDFAMIVSVGALPTLINAEVPADLARVGIPKTEYNLAHRPGLNRNLFRRFPDLAASEPSPAVRRAAGLSLLRSLSGASPHVWIHGMDDEAALVRAVAQVITHGGIANVDISERRIAALAGQPSAKVAGDRLGPDVYRRLFALGAQVSPAFEGAALPRFAAVLFAEEARDARPLPDAWREVIGPASRAFGALTEAGWPVDMVDERFLAESDLAGYRVLLVPEAAALTEAERANVAAAGAEVIPLPALTADPLRDAHAVTKILGEIAAGAGRAAPRLRVSAPGAEARLWQTADGFLASIVLPEGMSGPATLRVDLPDAPGAFCAADLLAGTELGDAAATLPLAPVRIWHLLELRPCRT